MIFLNIFIVFRSHGVSSILLNLGKILDSIKAEKKYYNAPKHNFYLFSVQFLIIETDYTNLHFLLKIAK